jgi:hypothetical protein
VGPQPLIGGGLPGSVAGPAGSEAAPSGRWSPGGVLSSWLKVAAVQ